MAGVCLIVGAGPGIGRALALAFARDGMDVAIAARSAQHLGSIVADVQTQTGQRAQAFGVDAGSEKSIGKLVEDVTTSMGPIEVAIYNAASVTNAVPTLLTIEVVDADFRVNVLGALALAQKVTPAMRAAGTGTLIFTGGGFAIEPAANYASLGLGKAALRNLTFSLAQELGKDGIHVATVTVHGFVQPGTHFDPSRIAKAYVELHRQPKGHFDIELAYK